MTEIKDFHLKIKFMDKIKKRMYLVKREVMAKNIKEALLNKGRIYEVQECKEEPIEEIRPIGFSNRI